MHFLVLLMSLLGYYLVLNGLFKVGVDKKLAFGMVKLVKIGNSDP